MLSSGRLGWWMEASLGPERSHDHNRNSCFRHSCKILYISRRVYQCTLIPRHFRPMYVNLELLDRPIGPFRQTFGPTPKNLGILDYRIMHVGSTQYTEIPDFVLHDHPPYHRCRINSVYPEVSVSSITFGATIWHVRGLPSVPSLWPDPAYFLQCSPPICRRRDLRHVSAAGDANRRCVCLRLLSKFSSESHSLAVFARYPNLCSVSPGFCNMHSARLRSGLRKWGDC